MTLQETLQFLNQNNGSILTILTAVYVLATIATVIFVGRSNKLVRESNKIACEAIGLSSLFEKERNRPYVIFDLEFKKNVLYAVLKNIGRTPAIDVNIVIDPTFLEISIDKRTSFLCQKTIAFMAPGRILRDFINTSPGIFKDEKKHVYNVKIMYKDTLGAEYNENPVIDIDYNKGLTWLEPPKHLKDIATEIKNSTRSLQEMEHSLGSLVWQQNSIVEKKYLSELHEDADFNAVEFIKQHFKDDPAYNKKIYFDLLSHYQTIEYEKHRNDILRCEKLGLIRRERSYFVLTEEGYKILNNSPDSQDADKQTNPES